MDPDFLDWIRIFGQFGSVLREKAVFQIRVFFRSDFFSKLGSESAKNLHRSNLENPDPWKKHCYIIFSTLNTVIFGQFPPKT